MPRLGTFGAKIINGRGLGRNFQFIRTIAANVENYNIRNEAIAAGWNGTAPLIANITIDTNVYVWSDTTSVAAFATGTVIPANSTIEIVNNGFIMGRGGDGGGSTASNLGTRPGGAGGPAMNINYNVTITNNGYIAGGGGGGDGFSSSSDAGSGGGGAGGGRGGTGFNFTGSTVTPSPPGGSPGGVAATPAPVPGGSGAGYSGGRILPGSTANQAGGQGGATVRVVSTAPPLSNCVGGGGGGGWGATGGSALAQTNPPVPINGAGGLTNQAGQNAAFPVGSGALGGGSGVGGKCVNLNGFTVTWLVNGNRYGAIS